LQIDKIYFSSNYVKLYIGLLFLKSKELKKLPGCKIFIFTEWRKKIWLHFFISIIIIENHGKLQQFKLLKMINYRY